MEVIERQYRVISTDHSGRTLTYSNSAQSARESSSFKELIANKYFEKQRTTSESSTRSTTPSFGLPKDYHPNQTPINIYNKEVRSLYLSYRQL